MRRATWGRTVRRRHPSRVSVAVRVVALRVTAVMVTCSALLSATGCTEASPPPTTAGTPQVQRTAPSSPPPTAPVLVADGTAADNLAFFSSVVGSVWTTGDAVRGAAYIDALTAAGFDRSAMQLTADTTTIGRPAESIQISVAWRDACLVGQVGPATGAPVVTVLPLLVGGGCLIGRTVAIDG